MLPYEVSGIFAQAILDSAHLTEGEKGPDLVELHDFCAEDMPYFAVPRYIEFVEEIPRTPNEKVENELRERGVTDETWDSEEAGVKAKK